MNFCTRKQIIFCNLSLSLFLNVKEDVFAISMPKMSEGLNIHNYNINKNQNKRRVEFETNYNSMSIS